MVALLVEGITRRVAGEDHLHGVDLRLDAGSFHVLLGPTAAGKTSLMRVIAGLDPPTSGRVRMDDGSDLRGEVAMVYQEFVNYPSLSVAENIAAPLRARRLPRREIERRVQDVAQSVGLASLLDRLPAELSGGQQQRTAMARALVRSARVVLLDEPLANLDYKLREELREQMLALFDGAGTIVVYATTDPAEALGLGGRVVVMDEGRVLQHGAGRAVYDTPRDERVARATSDPPINLWDASHTAAGFSVSGRSLPLPGHLSAVEHGPLRLGLRPHHVRLAPTAGAVQLSATVELAEVDGSRTTIHARAGTLAVLAHETGVHALEVGARVDLFLDCRHLLAFGMNGRLLAAPDGS